MLDVLWYVPNQKIADDLTIRTVKIEITFFLKNTWKD